MTTDNARAIHDPLENGTPKERRKRIEDREKNEIDCRGEIGATAHVPDERACGSPEIRDA